MSDEASTLPPDPGQGAVGAAENRGQAAAGDPGQGAGVTTTGEAEASNGTGGPPKGHGLGRVIIDAVTQGSPAVVTILAIFLALVVGGLIIAFSDTTVLHAWGSFFS